MQIITTILPYHLKDKSEKRILAELNAKTIISRDGRHVMYERKAT